MSRIYEDDDPAYAERCSDVTLCSNSKGFFKNLSDELVSMTENSGWLQVFENIEDGQKVAAVQGNTEVMEALDEVFARIQPMFREKDAKLSQEKRLAAQSALSAGDLTKALALSSQAVLRAPMTGVNETVDGGLSLALALWVRSEILLLSNQPGAALEDLKISLKERLPVKMRAQYYWRMGHCYKGTGEPSRSKVSYELAERLLGKDEDAKIQLNKDIESLNYNSKPESPPDKLKGAVLSGGQRQNMPTLSKLVKIVEEEDKGRFAIASASIKAGDVLLVDNPYASCLLSDYYGSHCLHCYKRLQDCNTCAPVWCPKCSGVAFCSFQCRDLAISTYHQWECPFLDLFIGSGMSILSHIALRMVTQAGLDCSLSIHTKYLSNDVKLVEGAVVNDIEGNSRKSKMKSRKERLNRTKKNLKNISDKYEETDVGKEEKVSFEENLEFKASQIYSLCTHSSLRKSSDALKRVVMAMFLTECLKVGGFFKNCQEILPKAKSSICELIYRNLQLLQFNAHEIYEILRGEHQISNSKPLYIAVGIYPTGALFNHECYPAVARYFEGHNIVFKAIRPLSPGEVVSENYGPHFLMRELNDRQRSLSCRYWFKCQCTACKEDWPTLKQMKKGQLPFLRCPNLSCTAKFNSSLVNLPEKCPKCCTPINHNFMKKRLETVKQCIQQYQTGAEFIEDERISEAISIITEAVDQFHEVAAPSHLETHIAQEALRSCFASYGNVHIVNIQSNKSDKDSSIYNIK